MKVFVTGGCKNGKSTYALKRAVELSKNAPRYYIATLEPMDEEQWQCVRRHRDARAGLGFETLECPLDILEKLKDADCAGVFLLDSVTALLSNSMFSPCGDMDVSAADRIISDLESFLDRVKHAVIVSDYIYSDGMDYSQKTQAFGKALARLDCFLAKKCDCVVEICAGSPTVHKDNSEVSVCI